MFSIAGVRKLHCRPILVPVTGGGRQEKKTHLMLKSDFAQMRRNNQFLFKVLVTTLSYAVGYIFYFSA